MTLLETVRELKELGISVYFEEQSIDTATADGELMKAGLVWCYLVVSVHSGKTHESLDTLSFSCLVVPGCVRWLKSSSG